MDLFQFFDPLYSISGFFVGAIVGITGVGGGSLMTPLLILLFGVHPATAVGTDLLYAATTKTAGTLMHGRANSVDWRIVGRLAAGSVPAAALTILLLSFTGIESKETSHVISVALGGMLIVTSLSIFFRKQLMAMVAGRPDMPPQRQLMLTVLVGAAMGVLVSVSSVGAGAIGVTALLMLYPRLPTLRVIASDIAHAVPLTLVAGLGHWAIGSIDWHMLVSLLIGSIPGIIIASYFAPRLNESVLRVALGAVLAIVGFRLLTS